MTAASTLTEDDFAFAQAFDMSTQGDIETDVYRLYDRSMNLLYVGKSFDWQSRTNQHKKRTWWRDVRFVEIVTYPSEFQAWVAEDTAIKTEDPVYNLQGTIRDPRSLPRGPRKPRALPPPAELPQASATVLPPLPAQDGPAPGSDEYWQLHILHVLEKLTSTSDSSGGFLAGDISRKIVDRVPRRYRTGPVRCRVSEVLNLMALGQDSPVRLVERGTNPVNKLPILAYALIPTTTKTIVRLTS